ncbi:hypothetical protein NESM_000784000 [Novymonas esmeraldas]|uniref:Uncharacterized protein n=1 Tax=Novymonas esmeraldas TaxID=1808958 RepID=A0AAW0EVH3_9TRYP
MAVIPDGAAAFGIPPIRLPAADAVVDGHPLGPKRLRGRVVGVSHVPSSRGCCDTAATAKSAPKAPTKLSVWSARQHTLACATATEEAAVLSAACIRADDGNSPTSPFQSRAGSFYASLMASQQLRQQRKATSAVASPCTPNPTPCGCSTASGDAESPLQSQEDSHTSFATTDALSSSFGASRTPHSLEALLAWRHELLQSRMEAQAQLLRPQDSTGAARAFLCPSSRHSSLPATSPSQPATPFFPRDATSTAALRTRWTPRADVALHHRPARSQPGTPAFRYSTPAQLALAAEMGPPSPLVLPDGVVTRRASEDSVRDHAVVYLLLPLIAAVVLLILVKVLSFLGGM